MGGEEGREGGREEGSLVKGSLVLNLLRMHGDSRKIQ